MEHTRIVHSPRIDSGDYVRAILNILDDFSGEKARLEGAQKAILNIMEDFAEEKTRLELTQKAVLNILEDAGIERRRLEDMQKAVVNILDDLEAEKLNLQTVQNGLVVSEQSLRGSLKEKDVLLKEVHHRVKNNLQVISSLLSLQARYLVDESARDMFLQSQGRVQSIALVHEKLYKSMNVAAIDFGDYVDTLVNNLLFSLDSAGQGIRLDLAVSGIALTVDLAIPCGLIINELVTNALKHAFPQGRAGIIHVHMSNVSPKGFELKVADDGVGLPKDLDIRSVRSLGLELVMTFADQLDAKVDIARDNGTQFRFNFGVARER